MCYFLWSVLWFSCKFQVSCSWVLLRRLPSFCVVLFVIHYFSCVFRHLIRIYYPVYKDGRWFMVWVRWWIGLHFFLLFLLGKEVVSVMCFWGIVQSVDTCVLGFFPVGTPDFLPLVVVGVLCMLFVFTRGWLSLSHVWVLSCCVRCWMVWLVWGWMVCRVFYHDCVSLIVPVVFLPPGQDGRRPRTPRLLVVWFRCIALFLGPVLLIQLDM